MPDAAVAAAETKAAPAAEAKASASKSRRPGGGTIDISMFTGAQRAATVIIALGAERASALYKHMEPEDVEQLTLGGKLKKVEYLVMSTVGRGIWLEK